MQDDRTFDFADLISISASSIGQSFVLSNVLAAVLVLVNLVFNQAVSPSIPTALAVIFVVVGTAVPLEIFELRKALQIRVLSRPAILPLLFGAIWPAFVGLLFALFLVYFRGAQASAKEIALTSLSGAALGLLLASLPAIRRS
jgi:hypothetical protein